MAMTAFFACGGGPPAGGASGDKSAPPAEGKEVKGNVFGKGTRVPDPGVAEPSGIAFHERLGHLFVVGDEGTLAELDGEGKLLRKVSIHANLEDVTVHAPTGDLLLLDENKAVLIVFDPVAFREKARWRLDADEIVGKRERGRDGFEGVGFRPEKGRPGGGIFYLTHQRGPALLVAIQFDPTLTPGKRRIGDAEVVGRYPLSGHRDLTSVTWSAALDRLLVLADSEDELLVVTAEGKVEARLPLPGLNQEGVALDPRGDLWIADDRGASVTRYPAALKAIEVALYSRLVK
jgi:uncharacterized protein YjiK